MTRNFTMFFNNVKNRRHQKFLLHAGVDDATIENLSKDHVMNGKALPLCIMRAVL